MKMQTFPLFAAGQGRFGLVSLDNILVSTFASAVFTIVFTIQVNAFFIRKLKSNNLLMS